MNWFTKLLELLFGSETISSETMFSRGNEAYRQENFVEALNYYQKAWQSEPQNPKYKAALARVYIKLGWLLEARDLIISIIKKHPNYIYARQLLEKIDTQLNARASQLYQSSKLPTHRRSSEPITVLKLLRINNENTLTAPPIRSNWYGLYKMVQQERFDEALVKAQYYISTYPNPEYGYYLLGYIYDRLSRWEEAAFAYRSAIQMGRRGRVYNRLARVSSYLR